MHNVTNKLHDIQSLLDEKTRLNGNCCVSM